MRFVFGLVCMTMAFSTSLFGAFGDLRPGDAKLSDSVFVNALNEKFKLNFFQTPDTALYYGIQALELAQEIGFELGEARITNNLGVFYSHQGEYEKALPYFQVSRDYFDATGAEGKLSKCLLNLGSAQFNLGRLEESKVNFENALLRFTEAKDTIGWMNALGNLGNIHGFEGRADLAMADFLKVLRFQEERGDSASVANTLINLGSIYEMRKDYYRAGKLYFRSLQLYQAMGNKFGQVSAMIHLSQSKRGPEEVENRQKLLVQGLVLAKSVDDQYGQALCHQGLSEVFLRQSEFPMAQEQAEKALAICQEVGSLQGEAKALLQLGEVFYKKSKVRVALFYLEKSLKITQENSFQPILLRSLKLSSECQAKLGYSKSAYESLLAYQSLQDSLQLSLQESRMAELNAEYEDSRQEQYIQRLEIIRGQDGLTMARNSRNRSWLLAGILVLVFFVLLLLYRFRAKRKLVQLQEVQHQLLESRQELVEGQNRQIRNINSNLENLLQTRTKAVTEISGELDLFLYESSHALRRPWRQILGLVGILEEKVPESDMFYLKKIQVTIKGMDKLFQKLVLVHELLGLEPELELLDLENVWQEVIQPYEEEKVDFKVNLPEEARLFADSRLVEVILQHIVENSLDYAGEGKQDLSVSLSMEVKGEVVCLCVSDNGSGVPEDQFEKVFQMFYRASLRPGGNGLGLYVVKKAVEKAIGRVWMESVEGKGTQVFVELPRHFVD